MVKAVQPSIGGRAEDGKLLSHLEWPTPKVEQPSSFLVQIFGNTELTACVHGPLEHVNNLHRT